MKIMKKKAIIGGVVAALIMGCIGISAFADNTNASSKVTQDQSSSKAAWTSYDDRYDNYDGYGDYSEDGWSEDYSLEDYTKELESAVKAGTITEDEKTQILTYYELAEQYETVWNTAWENSGNQARSDAIEKEYAELESTVSAIENKLPDTLESEESWSAYVDQALTADEKATLSQLEADMEALDEKYEAASERDYEALEAEYAALEEKAEPLYEKVYNAMMDALVADGTITAEERQQLEDAYAQMEALEQEYEALEDSVTKTVSSELADIEQKLSDMENSVYEIEEKLYGGEWW